ncbi:tyrosine-protein phosphatase [Glaciecola petra]|uniref:protein-tyrosine-phosphatase n=1 Tax=Glaciecola petra TaxID=3075602 RepID=A0ABU2ZV98_9ALTE|nr:CpsB/CapC family capsule biosynthesis tyrosine phosphatase [Aestuariibacter sp. P117]MDT0595958.1 CpsB/CapC family capsule biosynthesis tyrosine phosphatase [Aestuariibacter sp. P117]
MIDLHSHILPGIDDGARTADDTVAIAKNSFEAGVTHIMCTPHIHLGIFNNNTESIAKAFLIAQKAITQASIPIKLSVACEVRICPEIIPLVQNNKLPFIGEWDGKKALLLELPHSHVPAGAENLIKWLIKNDIQPVIPHVERNRDVLAQYKKAAYLFKLGCLFQVTAGAFVGRFGSDVEATAWQLLNDDMLCYAASDTHNVHKRPNDMQVAYEAVKERVGKQIADSMFINMPTLITQKVNWK